ncbi:hypothetical protein HPB52_017591 [Rhipicephalus sanguineus]|uniref:Uncharacterized protein n=1 Tax=Rhipicephalus sanguineus TaxID=34632 RepID=A0A9D4Q1D4_RHISA|nr:hypothetical protein HPB52_017591 [Rhipicephalus sanguineus]
MQQTPSSSRNASQKPELTPVHRASRRIRGLAPEIVPRCTTSTSTGMEDTTALTPDAIPAAAAAAAGAPAYYTLQKPRAFTPSSEPRRVSYADALRRTVPSSVTPPPVSGFQHASYADTFGHISPATVPLSAAAPHSARRA